MPQNRKTLYWISSATLVVLLLAFFLPWEESGRYVGSVVLVPSALACYFLVKKRVSLSINRGMVLFLLAVFGVVFITLYYLTGLWLGFGANVYRPTTQVILGIALPTAVIIIFSEIIRHVFLVQESRLSSFVSYLVCVVAECLTYGNFHYVDSFNRFMDFTAMVFLPAVIANLLYHYLSRRYGILPNVIYRLIVTLFIYLIPVVPMVSDSLYAFSKLVYPLIVYVFISSLYERKRRYALQRSSKLAIPLTVLAVAIMVSVIMLVSNQFRFRALVIATESMTGELNKGDIVLFDAKEDQTYEEGQVIVFKSGDISVVHRIIDKKNINGTVRYYTKGDANEFADKDYITKSDIIGAARAKLPYLGFPTLWLRELFASE